MGHLYDMSIETDSGRSDASSADRRQPFQKLAVFAALCFVFLFGSLGIHDLPAVYGAASVTLAVNAFTLDGNPVGGWITIQSRGSEVASGFTPLTFQGNPGASYSVVAHDSVADGDIVFDHWDDGSNDKVKVVKLKKNTPIRLAAYYAVNPTPSQLPEPTPPANPSTYNLVIGSSDMAGNAMTGYTVSVFQSDGVNSSLEEKTTPFTVTGAAGSSYVLEPADGSQENNNANMVFDHWEDGSTSRSRTIVLETDMTVTAHYRALPPPNTSPSATNDLATTVQNEAVTINVLANDTDSDGDTLFVSSVADPPSGSTTNNGGGTVTYVPDLGFSGIDSFEYTISDGNGGADTATVTLTVTYVEAPSEPAPEPTPVTYEIIVNSADMSGNAKTGMYTTIKEGGATLKAGFTPLSFTGKAGATYSVTVADYGSSRFDHWDNGSTTRTRILTLDADSAVTAFYRTPALTLNPTSGPADTSVYVTGIHFYPNSSVVVTYGDEQKSVASATADSAGSFGVSFAAPGLGTGTHSLSVMDAKGWKATATFEETATTLSSQTSSPETSNLVVVPFHQVYVPAYWGTWKQSLVDEWDKLIKSVKENPEIKFVVTINPASGPGTSQNALLASKAQALKEAGATVIGYVGVNYFSELPKSQYPVGNSWPSDTPKTMSDLKKDIDRYVAFYPMIDGFMFDDYPSKKTITLPDGTIKEVYSLAQDLDRYARSKPGITFIKANPGTAAHPDYFTLNENMSTYEGSSLPTLSRLDTITENGKYSSKTTVVVHSLLTLPDSRTIQSLYEKVDYLYITDNSYNALPSYWQIFLERVSNPS